MASELNPIDSRSILGLDCLVEEVRTSGKPRRVQRDHEDVAWLVPIAPSHRRRTRAISADDPLWDIIGMVTAYDGPADVSERVDRYLADAHAGDHP